MPMTGLLDWGDTMFRGTIMICSSSAFAATDLRDVPVLYQG